MKHIVFLAVPFLLAGCIRTGSTAPLVHQTETVGTVYPKASIVRMGDSVRLVCSSNSGYPLTNLDEYLEMYSDEELQGVTEFKASGEFKTVTAVLKRMPDLKKIDFTHGRIESIERSAFPGKLETLILDYNNLANLTSDVFPEGLKILSLQHNKIRLINSSLLPRNLQELDLAYNNLSSLDTENLPDTLRKLSIANNPLSGTFPVMPNLAGLAYLNAFAANIGRIDIPLPFEINGAELNFILCPLENPEEFAKIKNVKRLAFSVADGYDGEGLDVLEKQPGIQMAILPYVKTPENKTSIRANANHDLTAWSEPSNQANAVGRCRKGSSLDIANESMDEDGTQWYYVWLGPIDGDWFMYELYGWVLAEYVDIDKTQ